jgi:hypothetical protein
LAAALALSVAVAAQGTRRDLRADEALGGHTLARHVGKTDAELAARLKREPQISAASTTPTCRRRRLPSEPPWPSSTGASKTGSGAPGRVRTWW